MSVKAAPKLCLWTLMNSSYVRLEENTPQQKIARGCISFSFGFSCSLHFSTVDSRICLPCTSIILRDPAVGVGVVIGWKQRSFPTLWHFYYIGINTTNELITDFWKEPKEMRIRFLIGVILWQFHWGGDIWAEAWRRIWRRGIASGELKRGGGVILWVMGRRPVIWFKDDVQKAGRAQTCFLWASSNCWFDWL